MLVTQAVSGQFPIHRNRLQTVQIGLHQHKRGQFPKTGSTRVSNSTAFLGEDTHYSAACLGLTMGASLLTYRSMNVIGLSGLSHSLQFKNLKLPGLSQRE